MASLSYGSERDAVVGELAATTGGTSWNTFALTHPADRLIVCNRSQRDDIADSQEIHEQGGEDFAWAVRTSSRLHTSVLPKGVPTSER